MLIGQPGNTPSPGCPREKAHLHEVRLIDILQSHRLLPHCGGQRFQPHRSAGIVGNDAAEHAAVHCVQAQLVHLQRRQRLVRHPLGDHAASPDLGKIPHPPEKAVGNPGGASGPPGNFRRAGCLNGDP